MPHSQYTLCYILMYPVPTSLRTLCYTLSTPCACVHVCVSIFLGLCLSFLVTLLLRYCSCRDHRGAWDLVDVSETDYKITSRITEDNGTEDTKQKPFTLKPGEKYAMWKRCGGGQSMTCVMLYEEFIRERQLVTHEVMWTSKAAPIKRTDSFPEIPTHYLSPKERADEHPGIPQGKAVAATQVPHLAPPTPLTPFATTI